MSEILELSNNQTTIIGEIAGKFSYSHEIMGEGFYMMNVRCRRLSGICDEIPVMVSDRLLDVKADYRGQLACIVGQFRSYNRHEGQSNKLVLYVFAREVLAAEQEGCRENNQVFLEGFICREPVYRKTPLGREIADLILAVNRPYGKSDYIPCICWGRNARYAAGLNVGGRCAVWGRVQSRRYIKQTDIGAEERTAYEVSANRIEYGEG